MKYGHLLGFTPAIADQDAVWTQGQYDGTQRFRTDATFELRRGELEDEIGTVWVCLMLANRPGKVFFFFSVVGHGSKTQDSKDCLPSINGLPSIKNQYSDFGIRPGLYAHMEKDGQIMVKPYTYLHREVLRAKLASLCLFPCVVGGLVNILDGPSFLG